jgi:hypothetical protein
MLSDLKFHVFKSNKVSKQYKIWSRISSDQVLAVPSYNFFDESNEVFVIGSCFANEVRAVLEKADITVHPEIDPLITELFPEEVKSNPSWGMWDERVHYQCYTPMSVLQEVKLALGEWKPSDDAIIKTKKDQLETFWDPYRRSVYSDSTQKLLKLRELMNQKVIEGFEKSDLVIITLGLTEAHKLKHHEGYACELNPRFLDQIEFENLSYEKTVNALNEVCDKIHERWPHKKVIISVSPIPLQRTLSESDVVTATMRAKSLLRTAADTVSDGRDFCYYWPSYEYVMWSGNAFRNDDLRHVKQATVNNITRSFCESFFSPHLAATVQHKSSETTESVKKKLLGRAKKFARKYINVLRRKLGL